MKPTPLLYLSLFVLAGCTSSQPPVANWTPTTARPLAPAGQSVSETLTAGNASSPEAAGPAITRASDDDSAELAKLRELHDLAARRYAEIEDYICRFRRREFIHGRQEPEDLLEFRYRKQPESMYFKWIGGTLVGREMVFVRGKYDDRLQIRTGSGDPISGFRLSLDPHSARATANSRRTVDEAGVGNLIEQFGRLLNEHEKANGHGGQLRHLGPVERPESDAAMECVEQTISPRTEKHLPRGGRRFWFFNQDPRTREYQLPMLIVTEDETGREVEYYCFDRMNTNVGLSLEEFDPERIWHRR
ncbi:MAG: DUF1571 domain-containing protein [Gemmatales bacterium]|nr:DUF1571 domain-containing protein [Gemmatales bacterium]MDW8386351.1 DUF1571 domain-containing protein [Gemmatales bacterium]